MLFIIFKLYLHCALASCAQACNANLTPKLQLFFEFHKFYAIFLKKSCILFHYLHFSASKVVIFSGVSGLYLDV